MLRIAIIDDLSADRAVLREALERELAPRGAAFTIEEFASGEEFTAAFVPRQYDAAFIDIYMGEVSGMEVARLLYHRDPACRIIFLTTSQEFMLESYAVRAPYYLVKPFAEERLRQALDFCFPAPVRSFDCTHQKRRADAFPAGDCVHRVDRTAWRGAPV